jgi:nitrate reductase gamma subunit
MNQLLWLTVPYVAFTSFALGHIWRYRNDQFGWTTRSSQVFESKLLQLGSPLFHFGMLAVIGGHAMGLLIPESWTAFFGISEHMYHLVSVTGGTLSGVAVVVGISILLYRRTTVKAVRKATSRGDIVMYVLLAAALVTGMWNTVGNNLIGGPYNYRETVSPWFRSLFSLHPQPDLMANTPLSFQVHNLIVLTLIAIWPYTRLVHMFSAPIGYLVRPYVVYRSKDPGGSKRKYAKAWETPVAPPPRRW